ncbi:hypothetical protein MBLNU459_g8128t1 [Dothideomycetes sp. NU459]
MNFLPQLRTPAEAGHYTLTRTGVKGFVNKNVRAEDDIYNDALDKVDKNVLSQLGLAEAAAAESGPEKSSSTPICDRCHKLIHHHEGVPIFHPSIQSIEDIIAESPYKQNHIYHVLDAADFPMSLIPNLQTDLNLPRLRTQNRRSKSQRYVRGRIAEVSFIITRSDLLAPKKEQVDGLMPYLRETLRDALGKSGRNIRLGNVRCVSSKRGWWTKEVKEDIWNRGGAGWMVGKVNVGKSNLFESVFPKGRAQDVSLEQLRHVAGRNQAVQQFKPLAIDGDLEPLNSEFDETTASASLSDLPGGLSVHDNADATSITEHAEAEAVPAIEQSDTQFFDEDDEASLLPPAQPETAYPVMPVISSLPGTTASPIRIPFGNGKGELIDLPGVARSSLDDFVKVESKQDLVMRSRVTPDQYTIKPGQSLLLGGLIRITPTTPDLVFLAYPFVPLHPHITSTEKATGIQTGERESGVSSIADDTAGPKISSAGKYTLKWDVTRKRAGPLTSASAVKLKPEKLHFKVYSADILVEGVGWIELVAQVRNRQRAKPVSSENFADAPNGTLPDTASQEPRDSPIAEFLSKDKPSSEATSSFKPLSSGDDISQPLVPEVEVFTPEGKFVGVRPPMGAWLLGGKKPVPRHLQKSRPRKSMKSLRLTQRARNV